MNFPLSLSDVSLWLAVTAIILLITSELLTSPTRYSRSIIIDKKRFRLIGLAVGVGFIATVVLRVVRPF